MDVKTSPHEQILSSAGNGTDRYQAFWSWFLRHEPELYAMADPHNMLSLDERRRRAQGMADALTGIGHSFSWDVTWIEGVCHFVLSASGQVLLFPEVTRLVASAPELPARWRVRAFKQREDLSPVSMDGCELDPEGVEFAVHRLPSLDGLGVVFFIDGLDANNEPVYQDLAIVLLHQVLGEQEAAALVAQINVEPIGALPEAPRLPVRYMRAYFDSLIRPSVDKMH